MSLPKPYYDEDGITIYHGDCRDILPHLPKVDLVLTDPPYGISYQSQKRGAFACNNRTEDSRMERLKNDSEFPMFIFDVKPQIATMVFCRWDNLAGLPAPKSFIVWDKGVHSMGDLSHEFGRQWEGCAFYPGPEHSFVYRPSDVIRAKRLPSKQQLHPTQKPIEVLLPLIKCHIANTILDPFMGSGTTLVAAKQLGRKCIGIEIEEKYCEIAVQRLAQQVMRFE